MFYQKKRQNKSESSEFEGCKLLAFRCHVEHLPRESPYLDRRGGNSGVGRRLRCHFSSSPQLRMSPVINCAVFPHHVEHLIQISRPSVRRGSRECVTEVGRGEWLRPALHKHREFECGRWRMDAQTLTRTHTHIRTRQRFLSFSEC